MGFSSAPLPRDGSTIPFNHFGRNIKLTCRYRPHILKKLIFFLTFFFFAKDYCTTTLDYGIVQPYTWGPYYATHALCIAHLISKTTMTKYFLEHVTHLKNNENVFYLRGGEESKQLAAQLVASSPGGSNTHKPHVLLLTSRVQSGSTSSPHTLLINVWKWDFAYQIYY